MIDNSRI